MHRRGQRLRLRYILTLYNSGGDHCQLEGRFLRRGRGETATLARLATPASQPEQRALCRAETSATLTVEPLMPRIPGAAPIDIGARGRGLPMASTAENVQLGRAEPSGAGDRRSRSTGIYVRPVG